MTTTARILFVDDEQDVLDGLEAGLRPYRKGWDMVFETDPHRALDLLGSSPFDVIVSDMRMPRMDGSTLLNRVQNDHPQVVRVVLSAHADFEATLRAVPIAHHFLLKPCDTDRLWEVVRRSRNLQRLLADQNLLRLVGTFRDLPVAPRAYLEVTRTLARPSAGIRDVADVVEKDPGLATRILRLVNSACFGLRTPASSVHQAAVFLGTNMLRNLVLSAETFEAYRGRISVSLFEEQHMHATLVASLARRMLRERHARDDAYLAGIVHDVGWLSVALQMPAKYRELLAQPPMRRRQLERQILGATHAEIGAWIVGSWGLPYPIVEAVACHHEPRGLSHGLDVLGATSVADALLQELQGEGEIDIELVRELGVEQELTAWRAEAAEVASACGTS